MLQNHTLSIRIWTLLLLCITSACSSDPIIDDNAGGTEERPDVIGGSPSTDDDTHWDATFTAKNADGVLIHYNRLNADECEVARGNYTGDLNIPNTVAYRNKDLKVTSIERLAFARTLDDYYSGYNKGIRTISIPENMRHIGEGAFIYGLLESVNYASYKSLCSIKFDDGNSSPLICQGCQMLINGELIKEAVIPNGIDTIPPFAFAYNEQLSSVILSDGVKHIGEYSFIGCLNLTEIQFSDGLRSIGHSAFHGAHLQGITLPASISSIDEDAFAECHDLTSVRILNPTPPDCHPEVFHFYNSNNSRIYGTLRVPQGSLTAYHDIAPWNRFNSIKEFDSEGNDTTNDNALLYGTWVCYKEGHETEYWRFAENNTLSMWLTITYSSGDVTTRQCYTDLPFAFDAGTLLLKVFVSEDQVITYRLRDISADQFSDEAYYSYYRQKE